MSTIHLPPDLMAATLNLNDPLKRYAALMVCWGLNASDVTCRDLLTPGGKNALPVPQGSDWDTVLEHKHRWEDAIKASRMAAAATYSMENN